MEEDHFYFDYPKGERDLLFRKVFKKRRTIRSAWIGTQTKHGRVKRYLRVTPGYTGLTGKVVIMRQCVMQRPWRGAHDARMHRARKLLRACDLVVVQNPHTFLVLFLFCFSFQFFELFNPTLFNFLFPFWWSFEGRCLSHIIPKKIH